jgi:uncharacterized protein
MTHFWRHTRLDRLSAEQWEALCDGCGRCCLQKLRNPTTGKIYYTWVACSILDIHTCRCSQYQQRHILVHDCLELTPANISKLRWLPRTCAYRLVAENKELPSWHPLISGDPQSVHTAGISVRQLAISEQHVTPDNFEKYRIKERF